jgi:hypothetical protein
MVVMAWLLAFHAVRLSMERTVGGSDARFERIATDRAIRGAGCKRLFAPTNAVRAVRPRRAQFVARGCISSRFPVPARR